MNVAIRSRIWSSIPCAFAASALGIAVLFVPAASALTPLRSPEQLARDKVLFAQASRAITPQAMRCFKVPRNRNAQPFKLRFFLSDAGRRPSQFAILDASDVARAARSAPERAAIRAIRTCAPYTMPEELRSWGGFWVTVAF